MSLKKIKLLLFISIAIITASCNVSGNVTLNGTIGGSTSVSLGGVVTGLTAAESVTLQNNGIESVIVTGSTSFSFPTKLQRGESYYVTITSQPLTKTCVVGGNTGVAGLVDINDLQVTCSSTVATYSVGGSVTGLSGGATGLVLKNNGTDLVTINGNGTFAFPTTLPDTSAYNVTVQQQPSGPSHTCTVTSGTGTIAAANVISVAVNCTINTFTIGGTLTGLTTGTVNVTNTATGETLPLAAAGGFTFVTPQNDGTAYNVTFSIVSGPTSCSIANNTGTLGGANVTNVSLVCSYGTTYTVGGTLSGLAAGSTLVLQNTNTGEYLPLTANGAFTFLTQQGTGSLYTVTVPSQPGNPAQVCTVTSGSGTIGAANITNVGVSCVTSQFAVNVTVSGLAGADSITLQNNGVDNKIANTTTPSFSFTAQNDLSVYNVSILSPPSGKTCTISGGLGTLSGANASVTVTCSASPTYTVGGVVSGLASGSTGVTLQNNGGDNITLTANGTFAFPTALSDLSSYSATILTQPTIPNETCMLLNQTGTINGAAVTTISVTCTVNNYMVGGTINWNGIASPETVTLQYNGANDLVIASPTTNFQFPASFNDQSSYYVSVLTTSTPASFTCTPGANTGVINGGNVTSVTITCNPVAATTYSIGVNVTGFAGATSLMVSNNGSDLVAVSANGISNFSIPLASGAGYNLAIVQQPTGPNQSCTFTAAASGIMPAANTTVGVNCTTNTYTIGGAITGLANGEQITLQNNGADNLLVTGGGSGYDTFTFATQVTDLNPYNVTVLTPPAGKTCTPGANTGNVSGGPVTTVVVGCTGGGTPLYTIGGAVTGLATGNTVTLQNTNNLDTLVVSANGAFTFPTAVADASAYTITVTSQPTVPNQTCTVTGGSGSIATANVISVNVNCVTTLYTVQGTLSGLNAGDSITFLNNGSNPQVITSNGTFTFPAQDDGTGYNVTFQAPGAATSVCTMGANTGTINGANVTTVTATCSATGTFAVGGTVSGLIGGSVQLSLNGGLSSATINAIGAYSFPATLSSGTIYSVSVSINPVGPNQTCTVSNPNGTVAGTVTNINVACVTNTYTISGSVAGLNTSTPGPLDMIPIVFGSTAVLVNGDTPSFTSAPINDGTTVPMQLVQSPYDKDCNFTNPVPDATPPVGKWATVTIAGADITGVAVNCTTLTMASVDVTVSGMAGSGLGLANYITIPNSGGSTLSNLTFNANGTQSFMTQPENSSYSVVITTMPAGEICTVSGGTGTMASPAVAVPISVACTTSGGGTPTAVSLSTPATGSLTVGSTAEYTITGLTPASVYTFSLFGLTGDAGLFVFTDSTYTTVACTSSNPGLSNENCQTSGSGTYYIKVVNFATGGINYSLAIYPPPASEGSVATPIVLALNTPYTGQVASGGASYYQITGLTVGVMYNFSVSGLSAPADLNVYSTADFVTTTACPSSNPGTADESCTATTSGAYYLKVYGNVSGGANFTIKVTQVTPTNIALSTPTTANVGSGGVSYYQITGLNSASTYIFDLYNLSADVNLYVYTDSLFSVPACSSAKTGSSIENCLATGSTAYYIKIQTPSGTSEPFTLLVSTPTILTAGAGTGGSLNPTGTGYYQITGLVAGTTYQVDLSGISSSADLFVYTDNLFTTKTCLSAFPGTINDDCYVTGVTAYYIKVQGAPATTFAVTVNALSPAGQGTTVAPISINYATNFPYFGTVGAGSSYYSVTVPLSTAYYRVTVTSMSSNVDLAVYSSTAWNAGSLLGSSAATGLRGETVFASAATLYVKVTGTVAAAYTINVEQMPEVTPVNFGVTFNGGSPYDWKTLGGYQQIFMVTVPSSATVYNFTLSGFSTDLDLDVDSTVANAVGGVSDVCFSWVSAVGGSESCSGSGFTTYYIGVRFYTGNADKFTILVQ